MKSYQCIVSGKVQGVYYRKFVSQNASKAGFVGFVKNLSDGTVQANVTCDESRIEEFKNILQNGSPYSSVDSIKMNIIDEVYTNDFRIDY